MNGVYLCNDTCHPWAEEQPAEFQHLLRRDWQHHWLWHIQNKNPPLVRFTEEYLLARRLELKLVVKELAP
jgi:hypothetical protein